MSLDLEHLKEAIGKRKLPILTLDNKWHVLCSKIEKNSIMIEEEKKLNELLTKQGKLNTNIKQVRPLKKQLLEELVAMANKVEGSPNKKIQARIEEHKQLVEECNEKLEEYKNDMLELPREIKAVNEKLMLETMMLCYQNMHDGDQEVKEIEEWISKIRIELKKNLIIKQEKEMVSHNIYAYMHDIFGTDIMDLFDIESDDDKEPGEEDTPKEEVKSESDSMNNEEKGEEVNNEEE